LHGAELQSTKPHRRVICGSRCSYRSANQTGKSEPEAGTAPDEASVYVQGVLPILLIFLSGRNFLLELAGRSCVRVSVFATSMLAHADQCSIPTAPAQERSS
jgi:hypothetical protein